MSHPGVLGLLNWGGVALYLLVLNVGNGWEWGNGMIITSDSGSFPHSLLSTSKQLVFEKYKKGIFSEKEKKAEENQ